MSYIERDAALEFVRRNIPHINGTTSMKCVERAIGEIPTADVVEVVRCKDCIFYKANCCFNRQWDFESSVEVPLVRENDYCSYGERREG